jgi:hypothetical protein
MNFNQLSSIFFKKNPFKDETDVPFAKGRLAICQNLKLYITLIPKNLSSSTIYHILSLDYPELAEAVDIKSPAEIHKYTGLVLIKSLRNLDRSYKKIIILRDPVKRVLSGFYSKFIFDAAWSSEIIDPISRFLNKPVADITFRDFIFYLQCCPDEWLDAHFTSQSRFALFSDYDIYLNMDHRELLQEQLKVLGLILPRINDVTTRFTPNALKDFTNVDCSIMRVKEFWELIENNCSLPTLTEMVPDDLIEAIKKRFIVDYQLLDKCRN